MEKYILSILFIVFLFDIPVVKSTLSVFSTEKTYFTTNTYSEFNILRIKRNATKLSNKNESNTFEIPKSTREENKNQDQRELIKTTENITEKIVENDQKDSDEEPLVKTDSGMLRGLNMNIKGVKYYRFSKIPFAEKPIRFQVV